MKNIEGKTEFISAIPILASLNIRETAAFYVGKLGFEQLYVEQGVYGVLKRGQVEIHLWACQDRKIAEATACRVQVMGIRELYQHCQALHIVHPNAALTEKPWKTTEFAIVDPDGNLVTFFEDQVT